MKRRLTKKWINRYITPLLKGLPSTVSRYNEVRGSNGNRYWVEVVAENHTIIEGHIVPEGGYIDIDRNKLSAVMRTRETVKSIIANHKYVYVRIKPEISQGAVYMRLITERKAP